MKLFIVLFLAVLVILLAGVGAGAVIATSRALAFGETFGLKEAVGSAKTGVSALYAAAEGEEKALLERLSTYLDVMSSGLAKQDVFRSYYFRRLAASLGLLSLLLGVCAFGLWYFTLRAVVRPLESLRKSVLRFSAEGPGPDPEIDGVREIRDLSGAIGGMMRDIDLLGHKIRTMERANIGRFFVHQIRNSVTSIELCAGSLGTANAADIVIEEAGRINRLLERFRLTYKFPEPAVSPVELNSLGESLRQQVAGLSLEKAAEPVWIEADMMLLTEALLNLIQNAKEAYDEIGGDTRVTLTVACGPVPALAVTDRGRGMSAEEQSMMFSEYFTTKQTGMGLGLSFVKKVAESHGWSLDVVSELGGGTTIAIRCGRSTA